jgi:hypothetical protein
VLGMMGMLSVLNRQYVEPYNSVGGQATLVVIAGLFSMGLLWLRSLSAPSKTDRFLVFGPGGDRQATRAPVEARPQDQEPLRAVTP